MGNAGSLNRYAYVQGNPVNWTDPMGLFTCTGESGDIQRYCNAISTITQSVSAGWEQKLQNILSCDGKIRIGYPNETSDAKDSLFNLITSEFGVSASSPNSQSGNAKHAPLALLEALLLVSAKLNNTGYLFKTAYPTGFSATFSLPGNTGDSNAGSCSHRVELGVQMNTEGIVHELGHEFDCQGVSNRGSRQLDKVNNPIYYKLSQSNSSCLGQVRTIQRADLGKFSAIQSNGLEALVVGDRACVLCGVFASAPGQFISFGTGFGERAADSTNNNTFHDPIEVWADMFMNWVYDYSLSAGRSRKNVGFSRAQDLNAAQARRQWMSATMGGLLGNTDFF